MLGAMAHMQQQQQQREKDRSKFRLENKCSTIFKVNLVGPLEGKLSSIIKWLEIWFILRGDPVASDAINFPFEKGK